MKKNLLLILSALVFSLTFISCSDDDNDDDLTKKTDNHIIVNSKRIDEIGLSNLVDGAGFAIEYEKSKKRLAIIANFHWEGNIMKSRGITINLYNINIDDIPIGVNLLKSSSVRCRAFYSNVSWLRSVENEEEIGEVILKGKDLENDILSFEFKDIEFDDTPTSSGDGMVYVSGKIQSEITYFN